MSKVTLTELFRKLVVFIDVNNIAILINGTEGIKWWPFPAKSKLIRDQIFSKPDARIEFILIS